MKKTLTVLMMVLLAAMLIISCDNSTSEPKTETPTTTPSDPTPTPLKNSYTVTFSTGEGGSKVDSQEVKKNEHATMPKNDPTRTGYVFVRWSATENGEKAFDFTNTRITTNTTIYAVWAKVYKIGDEGPAGGIIFYDCDADNTTDGGAGADGLKSSDCGWRYLEAASQDSDPAPIWGSDGLYGTKTGIGEGNNNTKKLMDAKANDKTLEFIAAERCDAYSENGYTDWFLPSKDELNLMYQNLKSQNKGGDWHESCYWSSSEYNNDSESACQQSFFNGKQDFGDRNDVYCYVRPVRSFK